MTHPENLQTIRLVKSCEVALEVVDENLFVNTLIHQAEQTTQKQKFLLGNDFHLHQGPHGIVLYWGQNVYYLNKEGVLKNIQIPSDFDSEFKDTYVLSNIFEKKGIFVVYKQPESKNGRGVCFIYNTKTHENITLKTDHSFHSIIISDVQNLDFFLKDILRGELRISANDRVNKIPIKTITRKEKGDNKNFIAILGHLEFQFSGDFFLTSNGSFQQVNHQKNQITSFQHQYKIQYDQTVLNIIDVDKYVEYKLLLPADYTLSKILISDKGNFFCILQSQQNKQLAISRGHIDYLKPGQNFKNIIPLDYTSLRIANIGACSLNSQQLSFIGKKKNSSREFVILQVGLGQKTYFSYPLKAHELAGEVSIEYKDNTYKVNSLHMPKTKHAPTLLEYHYFQIDPQAKENKIKAQKYQEITKHIEQYRQALQEGKLDYNTISNDHQKLKQFMDDVELFMDQFQLGNSKTVLGKQREFIDFDPARVIELYKKIKNIG